MTSGAFYRAYARTQDHEGGYVDHPSDRGGPTNHGVTERFAREHDYTGNMRALDEAQVREWFRRDFWDKLALDHVAAWDEAVALELFDSAVNCGARRVGRWLQEALNALNRRGTRYPNMVVDGAIGAKTLGVLPLLPEPRQKRAVLKMLECRQGAHYLDLMLNDETQEDFALGWFERVGVA